MGLKTGSISTGSKEATLSGFEILKAGGNAFDAGIAAVFCSMISEYCLTGVGGGGSILVCPNNKSNLLYDCFVQTATIHDINKLEFIKKVVDFGDTQQVFHIGKGSAAIPGTLAGLLKVHQDFGRLPLSEILFPAINLAKSGVKINGSQSYIIKILEPILNHSSDSRKLFYKNGNILSEGDTFSNIDFGNFLELISKYGADYFYKGDIADVIDDLFKDEGIINKKYLSDYNVEIRKPIELNYRNHTILTNPAPSMGGSLILFLLQILDSFSTINNYNFIKSMHITSQAKKKICQNPDNEYEISDILKSEIIQYYISCIKNDNWEKFTGNNNGFGATTHVSVLDSDENAISITTTNGEGCGYIIPETGIMMNNMLGEQDLNPLGFHNWKKSRRLATMISPTIVLKNNRPFLVLGSGGSNRLRTAISQVLINIINKGLNLKDAIETPRIHLESNKLYIEPEIEIDINKLSSKILVNSFNNKNLFFGGVNAVMNNSAHADSRRDGYSLIE